MNLSAEESAQVRAYLEEIYRGAFSAQQIERHIQQYVEPTESLLLWEYVQRIVQPERNQKLLDIGCGFGSFVLQCRKADIEGFGIDVAEFEITFAQSRLKALLPDLDVQDIYRKGDAAATDFPSQSFDFVTAWNMLEHVPDPQAVLEECYRLLKPGGYLFIIAPNYLALRREAHYHVPWLPLLPRPIASRYLQLLGKNPAFFQTSIYYVTQIGIQRRLKQLGFVCLDAAKVDENLYRLSHPEKIGSPWLRGKIEQLNRWGLSQPLKMLFYLWARAPFKQSITLVAQRT